MKEPYRFTLTNDTGVKQTIFVEAESHYSANSQVALLLSMGSGLFIATESNVKFIQENGRVLHFEKDSGKWCGTHYVFDSVLVDGVETPVNNVGRPLRGHHA